jgi:hypothetical protein
LGLIGVKYYSDGLKTATDAVGSAGESLYNSLVSLEKASSVLTNETGITAPLLGTAISSAKIVASDINTAYFSLVDTISLADTIR